MQSIPYLMAIGSGISGGSQIASGLAGQQQADFNAKLAQLQAGRVLQIGDIEANRIRTETRGVVGAQRAGYAAQGVDVGSGSPVDVGTSTTRMGELDALMVRHNAAMEAWGLNAEASNLRLKGKTARNAGIFGAAGTVMGGFADAAYTATKLSH